MTISVLRSRLQYLEETGAPSYIPRSSFSSGPAQKKPTSVNNLGDLRVTVRNTPPSQSLRAPHSSMTLQPVELPRVRADTSRAVPVVTFGAPPEDQMSITAITTLDGGAAKGYVELPPVERSVAMQRCPKTATSWRGKSASPLPSM